MEYLFIFFFALTFFSLGLRVGRAKWKIQKVNLAARDPSADLIYPTIVVDGQEYWFTGKQVSAARERASKLGQLPLEDRPAVYLAGKMAGCTDDECNGWRDTATPLLAPLQVLNPMVRDFRDVTLSPAECGQLVKDDKADIDRAFAVIVRADAGASWGTSMETIYAHGRTKLVVAFVGSAEISPWLRAHAHIIVGTVEEACAAVMAEFLKGKI